MVETDDERLAFSQRWCSQITGRSEQQLGERRVVRLVLFHVQVNDVFAFGRVDVIHLLSQLQGFFFFERGLFCVYFFRRFDADFRKKLLRFPTCLSAGAVIAPIEFGHRVFLS